MTTKRVCVHDSLTHPPTPHPPKHTHTHTWKGERDGVGVGDWELERSHMNLDNHLNFSPIYIYIYITPSSSEAVAVWLAAHKPTGVEEAWQGCAFSCGGTRGHNSSFARGKKLEGKSRHFCRSVCVTVCEHFVCIYIYYNCFCITNSWSVLRLWCLLSLAFVWREYLSSL